MLALLAGLALPLAGCAAHLGSNSGEPLAPDSILVCDRAYEPTFVDLVDSARERIDIVQWELLDGVATDEIIEVLGAAADRGLAIRVLLDEEISDNHTGVDRLLARGVNAKLDNNASVRVHAKMVVADGEQTLLGSTNWSTASIDYNHECNVKLKNSGSASYLVAWIDQLWKDSSLRQPPALEQSNDARHRALVNDGLLSHLLEHIEAASESIDFTMYATYLQPSDPSAPAMQVFAALASAASRGVLVRGVADWSDWNPGNNESNQDAVNWLETRGVDMRWEQPDVLTHAKAFRIDDGLQIQTANVSSGGLAYNHEAGAWVTETSVREDFQQWFDALWADSQDTPPAR